jgi:hypothetical protein
MSEKETKRTLSLLECKTFDDVCEQEFDHVESGNFCILTDGSTVWLSEQACFSLVVQQIEFPKTIFDELVRKYAGQ